MSEIGGVKFPSINNFDEEVAIKLIYYYIDMLEDGNIMEEGKSYNIYDRIVNRNKKSCDVPLMDVIKVNDSGFAEYKKYEELIEIYGGFTQYITFFERFGCSVYGKVSPLDDFKKNHKNIVNEIRSGIKKLEAQHSRNFMADDLMWRYIGSYYYKEMVHTFPIIRSFIVYWKDYCDILQRLKERSISSIDIAETFNRFDMFAGWGDRLVSALIWKHFICKRMFEFGYSDEEIEEFKLLPCYTGFDINKRMEPYYKLFTELVCRVTGLNPDTVKIHIMDSLDINVDNIIANSQLSGVMLTSSPTRQELYSGVEGESVLRYPEDSDNSDATWITNFLCRLYYRLVVNPKIRYMVEFMDNYISNNKGKRKTVMILESFLEFFDEISDTFNVDAKLIKLMYWDEETIPFQNCPICRYNPCRKCKKCIAGKKCDNFKNLCNYCNNSHSLRSAVIIRKL